MTQKLLRLLLNTVDTQRAEAIGQVVAGKGWQLLPFVAQPLRTDWLQQLQVDMIVIDLDLPDALQQVKEFAQGLPTVPVLVLATQPHLTKLQDAFMAGAADFVAFPIENDHFTAAVQRAVNTRSGTASRATSVPRSRMIAVTGLRGGVGRSTIAANLAVAIQQRTKRDVVLAEAHHGLGHLSLMLNLHPRYTIANLAEDVNVDRDIVQAYLQPHTSGIRLLAAPTELAQVAELSTETWHNTLNLLTDLAPHVVVDTAANTDDILSEVLSRADDIVVVASPDIPSLRGAQSLLATLHAETAIRARIHVVLNRAGVRGGLDANVIQKQLREKSFIAIPEDTPLATYALNRGVPFVVSHPRAVISRRINTLVDQVAETSPAPVSEEKLKTPSPFRALLPINGYGKSKEVAY
ncbi:MAG: AAA family ATPase [Chloroflexi bacterium]|nr:AAA family ATPase [Chloroflexota bacterium]